MSDANAGDQAKIEIQEITKYFRWTTKGKAHEVLALDNLNFRVRPQEFLTVIGPSGCGKTTLLRVIGNLIKPDSGQILIDQRLVDRPGPDRAMVFQQFGLFPWKTVLDNVRFPLILRKMPKEQATAIAREQLASVGLDRFEESHPHQLSGGMQQRVGLARALACDPDILLMDEPFGAIDAQTREVMQEDLMRLWAHSRKTVVFITHDLDEAILLSDRILVLTRRPGRVERVVTVDLPRPRWEYDVRGDPRFSAVRREIWTLLRRDVESAEGEEFQRAR